MPPRMRMSLNNVQPTPIYNPYTPPQAQMSMGNMISRIHGIKPGCGSCGK